MVLELDLIYSGVFKSWENVDNNTSQIMYV